MQGTVGISDEHNNGGMPLIN